MSVLGGSEQVGRSTEGARATPLGLQPCSKPQSPSGSHVMKTSLFPATDFNAYVRDRIQATGAELGVLGSRLLLSFDGRGFSQGLYKPAQRQ